MIFFKFLTQGANAIFDKIVNKILSILTINSNPRWRNLYWNFRAKEIDRKWGSNTGDYDTLGIIIKSYNCKRILDIGCGSGRLFELYKSLNVEYVVAQEISVDAIKTCKERYPELHYVYELKEIKNFRFTDIDEAISLFYNWYLENKQTIKTEDLLKY